MGFFDDFAEGFQKPFVWVYDHGIKPVVDRVDKVGNVVDKVLDKAPDLVNGVFGAANGLLGLLNPTTMILIGGGVLLIMILK